MHESTGVRRQRARPSTRRDLNMLTQADVIHSLPVHLQPFVATQDYSAYTARDQAVWRFLLHQLIFSLQGKAHPTYFEGLAKTGISFENIPRIEEINHCLSKLGWRAVAVDGFLPPAVFMEFQAIKVLAIAVNIRSFEHMLYTPAPDIIHESAGHAPFLIDIDYAEFLQRFGELGMQAIANQHDMDIYEAVRELSIVKEDTVSTQAKIDAAQQKVEDLQNTKVDPSEANLLARLHWWTVEYGLVGKTHDYRIFGAGLLSSLSESQDCMNDTTVSKHSLTIDAINTAYDITTAQPQLFVTESCRHLSQVLAEYGRHMCCQRGGASALHEAKTAGSINTITLNSGIQIAGTISKVRCDAVGNAIYFNTVGPTQLAYASRQLNGHGIDHHGQGFGSPIGKLRAIERCLSSYTVDELKRHNIEVDKVVTLNFLSGVSVVGLLKEIVRREQKNIIFSFIACTVKDSAGHILFDPDWGNYDMAIGSSVTSVAGGSADQERYPIYDAPSSNVSLKQDYDEVTRAQFKLYAGLRECRESGQSANALSNEISTLENCDWLLLFEALELTTDETLRERLTNRLKSEPDQTLIRQGLIRLTKSV